MTDKVESGKFCFHRYHDSVLCLLFPKKPTILVNLTDFNVSFFVTSSSAPPLSRTRATKPASSSTSSQSERKLLNGRVGEKKEESEEEEKRRRSFERTDERMVMMISNGIGQVDANNNDCAAPDLNVKVAKETLTKIENVVVPPGEDLVTPTTMVVKGKAPLASVGKPFR